MRYNKHMNTQTATIKVGGNWDQISRFYGLRSLPWKVTNPKQPNRVELSCYDLAEGKYVYEMLSNSGLVSVKNWL
jgi:hypothetical protein